MISMARTFGAPVTLPQGSTASTTRERDTPTSRDATTSATRLHTVTPAPEHRRAQHADAARTRDATEIVAVEIDGHDQLGALLVAGLELARRASRRPRHRRRAGASP